MPSAVSARRASARRRALAAEDAVEQRVDGEDVDAGAQQRGLDAAEPTALLLRVDGLVQSVAEGSVAAVAVDSEVVVARDAEQQLLAADAELARGAVEGDEAG